MSSITQYETKDGLKLWRCQYDVPADPITGKRKKRQKRGFKTRKECELYVSRQLVNMDQYGYSENDNMTYKDVYEYFIESYKNNVKESTLNHVLGMFRIHILPAFGKKKMKKITVPICQKIVNDWSKELLDYKKIKNYANLIFKEAKRLNVIYNNPMDLIVMPKKKAKIQTDDDGNFWDKEELGTFLKQVNKYYSGKNKKAIALFRLMAFTGARKAEILALQVGDFNYKEKTLLINKTVTRDVNNNQTIGTPKTVNGYRTLYLDQNTADILNDWIKSMHKEMLILGFNTGSKKQLIFPNTKNQLLSLMKPNKWMNTVIDSYNIDIDI